MRRIVVALALLILGAFQARGQIAPRGNAPVVVPQSFHPSMPGFAGGVVGAVGAANAPTSWSIIAGDSAGDFAVSNSGVITFTSQGAKHYDGSIAEKSARLAIQAANARGATIGFIDINAYADGLVNAPRGSAQYPTLLSGYRIRPPWKVAGFDYYVGIPSGTVLSHPTTISSPDVTVSANAVICSGKGALVTLNAIDFTGYYVHIPSGGCSSLTITNSNFACAGNKSPAFTFFQDQNNATDVIRTSKINSGDDCGAWPNNVSDPIACGRNCTVEYNWFYHASERIVNMGTSTLYRWNLIDSPKTAAGAHENYQQFGGGITATSDVVQFNGSYNALPGGGEGYQFYGNVVPATIISPIFQFNTMIALKSAGNPTMSFMVHGSCHTVGSSCTTISGTGIIENNYFDPTGAYGIFYQGTLTRALGWSSRNNVNMVTGKTVAPQ